MKKRLWFVVLCVFALVGLTSCLDSVQAISYNDGQYYWYMKLSLSKALMEMAGEDPKVFFEELDNSDLSDLPDFVSVNPIETDTEVGVEISVYLDPDSLEEDVQAILPKKIGKEYHVAFLAGAMEPFDVNDFSNSNELGMAQALLSSAKCRVMIGKNIIPRAEGAYIAALDDSRYGVDYKMPVYDYGDSFCVEVPWAVLLETDKYDLSQVIFVEKTR